MADQGTNLDGGDVGYILSRFQRLMLEQRLFAIEWQEIADYMIPRKNSILVQRIPGSKRTQRLYDSTAADAGEKLASSIQGTLTSPYMRWFFLETDDPELRQDQETRTWLEDASERMNTAFNKSNFSQETHEMYLDLVFFATGCLFEDEKPDDHKGEWGGLRFRCVPIGKFVSAEGPDGRVNAVFRSFPLSAEAIKIRWKEAAPPEVADAQPDKQFEIIHGVYPSRDGRMNRWESKYLLYKGRAILEEGEFEEFPYMVPRWSKTSDETYGRGPAHTALPDTRSLNKIVELELRRIAMDVHPPMKQLNGDTIGPIRQVPGGVTNVRSMDGLQPLLTGAQQTFQIVNLKKDELRQSVREIFFYDQLQLPQGPQMTAEEVMTRMELMQRLLGPMMGRAEAEFLRPLIDRTWAIMLRRNKLAANEGILPPFPQKLITAMQQKKIPLRIRFEGPLARAQKANDATAIQATAAFMGSIINVKPDVADVVDLDEAVRYFAEVKGVPSKLILDKEQVQPIRDQRAEQQHQQNQMNQLEQGANAAGAAAPFLKTMSQKSEPGSPDDQMMGGGANGGSQAQTGQTA